LFRGGGKREGERLERKEGKRKKIIETGRAQQKPSIITFFF